MSDDLTPRQRSVLDFIVEFQKEHRMAPTVREIGEHLGLSAPAGIYRLLNVLKRFPLSVSLLDVSAEHSINCRR